MTSIAYYSRATIRQQMSQALCAAVTRLGGISNSDLLAVKAAVHDVVDDLVPSEDDLASAGSDRRTQLAAGWEMTVGRIRTGLSERLRDAGLRHETEWPDIEAASVFLPPLPCGAGDAWPAVQAIRDILRVDFGVHREEEPA